MKAQWALLIGLVFALFISFIAVINFESVSVNYIFGQVHIPLIIVIFISAFLGALTSGMFSFVRIFNLNREIKSLKKVNTEKVEIDTFTSHEVEDESNDTK